MASTPRAILAVVACLVTLPAAALAQRPEMTAPNWPGRYGGAGTQISGEVVGVDTATGQVRVKGPDGEMTISVPPETLDGFRKGDQVNVQSIPAGRSPSAVGGAASDDPPLRRILPDLGGGQSAVEPAPSPTPPPIVAPRP
jgi:hypothetical protein